MKTILARLAGQWLLIGIGMLRAATPAMAAEAADPGLLERIRLTHVFHQPIIPAGEMPPEQAETEEVWQAIQTMAQGDLGGGIESFESFVSNRPASAWTPSLCSHLGRFHRDRGRISRALIYWQRAWDTVSSFSSANGESVAGYTLKHWTRLLASLGRGEQLRVILAEAHQRHPNRLHNPLLDTTLEALRAMGDDPGKSYRCGTMAMFHVARSLGSDRNALTPLVQIPSPATGFSVSDLGRFSKELRLGLVAVRRTEGTVLVVPSVILWKQQHYAALVGLDGHVARVVDPTFGPPRPMHQDVVNEEASGVFLVPETAIPAGWVRLSEAESKELFGRGLPTTFNDGDDEPCEEEDQAVGVPKPPLCPTCPDENDCRGMAVWRVSEPYITLWIEDEPLGYRPSVGQPISFKLRYKMREEREITPYIGNYSPQWNCSWLSHALVLDPDGATNGYQNFSASVYLPGGGERPFVPGGTRDPIRYRQFNRVTTNGVLLGFELLHPKGSRDFYGFLVTNLSQHLYAHLTERRDPRGNSTRFQYELTGSVARLARVIDADGRTNTLQYAASDPLRPASIQDPYGRTAQLRYKYASGGVDAGPAVLTNIVDPAGIFSQFTYDGLRPYRINSLLTPYGGTTFDTRDISIWVGPANPMDPYSGWTYADLGLANLVNRMVIVDDAAGRQIFAYRNNSEKLSDQPGAPALLATNMPPEFTPSAMSGYAATENFAHMNSFHWDRRHAALLSTTNPDLFTVADYALAGRKRWLKHPTLPHTVGFQVALVQAPPPAASVTGALVWFNYDGIDESSRSLPHQIARVLPNGTNWTATVERNEWGHATAVTTPYAVGTNVASRTAWIDFGGSSLGGTQQPWRVRDPSGSTLVELAYDSQGRLTNMIDAVGGVFSYLYESGGRVTRLTHPTGLVTTNSYYPTGHAAAGFLEKSIDLAIGRTNAFTYNQGLVSSHTDALGLTRTFAFDSLLRLTSVSYPDGTSEAVLYNNPSAPLDPSGVKDRANQWTSLLFDHQRRLTRVTDPLTNQTTLTYCNCNAIESIVDPLNRTTSFVYDWNGRLTFSDRPDGSTSYLFYNSLDQVVSTSDDLGTRSFTYNIQGLVTNIVSGSSTILAVEYDLNDRPFKALYSSGLAVTNTFDLLGRTSSRTYLPAGGTEFLEYGPAGLSRFTDLRGKSTSYGYDTAARLTSITNTLGQVIQITNNLALRQVLLKDARQKETRWYYNRFGQTTNKTAHGSIVIATNAYDALGRLTDYWTPAKGLTRYRYDVLDSLTNIDYAASTDVTFRYDTIGRLTNMVDGLGSTLWSRSGSNGSETTAEDGPWSSDTVTTVTDPFLKSLSIQHPSSTTWSQTYAYSLGRLLSLTSPAGTFNYTYAGASSLATQIQLPNASTISNYFDGLGRLKETWLKKSDGTGLDFYRYTYDSGWRRSQYLRHNSDKLVIGYDDLGQVTSATGYEPNDSTPRLHEQFGYTYDAGWNLATRSRSGLTQSFAVDDLNRLTTAANSGTLTLAGTVNVPGSTVTVNGSAATVYADGTFIRTGQPLTGTYTAVATDPNGRSATNVITASTASSVTFTYDANGNLTSDGQRSFAYDDENRLAAVWVTNLWKSEFTYDGLSRRRIRKEFIWASGNWSLAAETRYLYDGMLVVQERDGANAPTVTYTRGADLSGTLESAGGIGGLLALTRHSGSAMDHFFYHADGGGNISAVVNAAQAVVARYRYDPFGNTVAQSGYLADANSYRFSSKEFHPGSGLYHFGYRFYEPNLQRWINRDPIGEEGGSNLYGFAVNGPVNHIDPDGALPVPVVSGAIGALIGGGIAAWNGGGVGDILRGAGRGALAGAMAGLPGGAVGRLFGGGWGGTLARGALGGAAGDLAAQGVENALGWRCGINWTEVGLSGVLGGAGAGAGKACGLLAAKGGTAYRVMSEAELTGAKVGKYADGPYMNPADHGKKWVWGTKEQAEGWKAVLEKGGDVPHVITEIPTRNPLSTYRGFDHGSRPSGPAYLVPFEELGPATPIR